MLCQRAECVFSWVGDCKGRVGYNAQLKLWMCEKHAWDIFQMALR